MKVSLRWMQQLAIDNNLPVEEADLLEKIGSQLGAVEDSYELTSLYDQAVIAKVINEEPLEGSDHLHVCLIDDQKAVKNVDRLANGLVQVVCGAPNVTAGINVIWLPPGSIVPATVGKDPLELSARPIMGTVSNGMLASGRELKINDDHDGIIVLPEDATPGSKLTDYLLLDDLVIDIENKMFTHRPDLFGQLGVARELCGIYGRRFVSPKWYDKDRIIETSNTSQLSVDNQLSSDGCPRFMAVSINNLKIEPSPLWLQSFLSRTGVRPINNIVDVTNYVMMATGQPLHAYDLNKVGDNSKAELIVRHPKEGETLTLLDGSELDLLPKDIVIANSQRVLGLGGIMGGQSSEVDEQTTAIVLECANFDMYQIRRSAFAHGVFSEAVVRFTKGLSPWQCQPVLAFAIDLIKQLCPTAEVISEVADASSGELKPCPAVSVGLDLLNSYLGEEIKDDQLVELLNNVELSAKTKDGQLMVNPPFWRTDIVDSEDIIEEVARLKGFDTLPKQLPLRRLNAPILPQLLTLKQSIRQLLSAGGSNEVLSYSFVDEQLMQQTGQDTQRAFTLANALSPELKYYRMATLPSILKKVHSNHKAGYERFALFEIGKAHFNDLFDDEGLPQESERLALVVSADTKAAEINYQGSPYYQARYYLDYLLGGLNLALDDLQFNDLAAGANSATWQTSLGLYYPGHSAVLQVGDDILGIIGEFSQSVTRALKLPTWCAGFELDLTVLQGIVDKRTSVYRELSRYPKVTQDLTVSLPPDRSYAQIRDRLYVKLADHLGKDMAASLRLIDIYRSASDEKKHWTFRLEVDSYDRTLTEQEVTKIVEELKAFNDNS